MSIPILQLLGKREIGVKSSNPTTHALSQVHFGRTWGGMITVYEHTSHPPNIENMTSYGVMTDSFQNILDLFDLNGSLKLIPMSN